VSPGAAVAREDLCFVVPGHPGDDFVLAAGHGVAAFFQPAVDAAKPIVQEIAKRSAVFGKPVYLFNGDSHLFNSDTPLAPGSPWLNLYDVSTPAPNLTRITVDGSTGVNNYLRVSINPSGPQVLTWVKVPLTAP
jgi:hypothetical protein